MIAKCKLVGYDGFVNKDDRHSLGLVTNENCPLKREFCRDLTIGSCDCFIPELSTEEKIMLEGYEEHRLYLERQNEKALIREKARKEQMEIEKKEKLRLNNLMEKAVECGLENAFKDPEYAEVRDRIKQRMAWRKKMLKDAERMSRVDKLAVKYGLEGDEREIVVSMVKDFERNKKYWKKNIKRMYAEEERDFVLMILDFFGVDEAWVTA